MRHIVSFSGGKDSTAMLILMHEKGMQMDDIIFCDTGKEFPELYQHIEQVEAYIGRPITRLKAEKSFDYFFTEHIRKRGKFKGKAGYGWPSMQRRWCTRELKLNPIKEYLDGIGDEYIQYIGIAADEPKRHERCAKNTVHPLFDWGITEKKALEICYERGFRWGGLYEKYPRVSCFLCPMQRISTWKELRRSHPHLWEEALRLDKLSGYQLNVRWSLNDLEKRFQKEDESDEKKCTRKGSAK